MLGFIVCLLLLAVMYRPKNKKLWIYPVTPQWDIVALPWNESDVSSDPSSVTSESTGNSDDCAADELLNRYPFRPPGVAGRP